MKNTMKKLVLGLSLAALAGVQANAVVWTVGELPLSFTPQHELSGTGGGEIIKADGSYYDPTTFHAYMVNEPPSNPVKYVWMHLTFDVGNANWTTAQLGSGATVVGNSVGGSVTEDIGKGYTLNGTSLDIWQTWDIKPNPQSEDFYLSGFFTDSNGHSTGLQLTSLDIKTICVPEPTTVMAAALLLTPLGVSTLRKLRKHSVA